MKKSTVILMHIAYWFVYFLFSVTGLTRGFVFDNDFIAPLLERIFFGMVYFYISYFFLVPKYLAKREVKTFFRSAIGLSMLGVPLIFIYQFFRMSPQPDFSDIQVQSQGEVILVSIQWALAFIISTIMFLIPAMMGAVLRGFITWYDEIHIKEVLIRKNLETELALLKAQLNPHFLFNTLNNIDILIEKNASAASVYLKKLSDIMRFTLYDTQEERIPLEQELEYIRKFIDLQHIRTAGEFVELDVSGDPKNFSIAPMVFIPFIENAFKHSTNKKIENAIVIKIKIADNTVLFSCVNVIDKERPLTSHKSGLGLDLIRQRLQLLYKDSHSLEIGTVNDMFNVSLKLNLNAA
ncbi:MAG TPA: sensor histidine kinase [Chryseolinea sp.]|nr:sensor histidine kinase [Chryseolinea sp.]